MKTEINMGVLGIYIYNADRKQWLVSEGVVAGAQSGLVKWGTFEEGKEWTQGEERNVEEIREKVSGNEVTYTIALLQ